MRPATSRVSAAIRLFIAVGPTAILWIVGSGCASRSGRGPTTARTAAGSSVYVASLGNLRTGRPPSTAQIELATFLFGVEPDPPLGLIKPMHAAVCGGELWVCDGVLQTVLRWTPGNDVLQAAALDDPPAGAVALAADSNGERLVGGEGGVVVRYSALGKALCRYKLPGDNGSRVGGIARIRDEVWVSNVPAHCIEIFDAATGAPRRAIGERGRGAGQFGFPLDLAVGRDGNAYVVDMLNARVQVLDPAGRWLRDIGGPGDRVGTFGRPKAVAIGPDGTIFVADAASQCVHAFDENGQPLLSFGGAADGDDALVLPAGIAIWSGSLDAAHELPGDFKPAYYVLVAEQLVRPGMRVYAWSGSRTPPEPAALSARHATARPAAGVANPHWRADACATCHSTGDGRPGPIDHVQVDGLCLSCHDGKKAVDEAHPIGRRAITASTRIPAGWPLAGDRLGCLTCHDIRRHCDRPQARPADNPAMVRGFDSRKPLASCLQCHLSQEWRVNPHRNDAKGAGAASAACGFCHVSTPRQTDSAGGWAFDAALRDQPIKLCLNCHSMHADPAPNGHLDALVPEPMLRAMLAAEGAAGRRPVAPTTSSAPAMLPLSAGRVACSTCHNPHAADGPLAALLSRPFGTAHSTAPVDAGKGLRMPHTQLCVTCHEK